MPSEKPTGFLQLLFKSQMSVFRIQNGVVLTWLLSTIYTRHNSAFISFYFKGLYKSGENISKQNVADEAKLKNRPETQKKGHSDHQVES